MFIKRKKIIFVGDVHGKFHELKIILKKFPNHLILLLGDLQDRGLYSKEVLDLILKNKNIIALKGNHDLFFLDFMLSDNINDLWISFLSTGGINTILSYLNKEDRDNARKILLQALDLLENFYQTDEWKNNSIEIQDSLYLKENINKINFFKDKINKMKSFIKPKYVNLINSLPSYFQGEDWIATHAPIFEDTIDKALTSNSFFFNKFNASQKEIHQIHGHTNKLNIKKHPNGFCVYGIDNSSNAQLCALDWKNKTLHLIDFVN
jgi:predicted MPP superfamily phosphohydrolase